MKNFIKTGYVAMVILIFLLSASSVVAAESKKIKTVEEYRIEISKGWYGPLDIFKVCIDGRLFLLTKGGITQVIGHKGSAVKCR